MKKSIFALTVSASLLISIAATVFAAGISPGLDIISNEYDMTVSANIGEKVFFSEKDFKNAAGLDSFEKIRIVSLPAPSEGILCFNDSAVAENQVIKADQIKWLHFDAADNIQSSSFRFTFDGAYSVCCNIKFTDKVNAAPNITGNTSVSAMSGTVCAGVLRATDPDGDAIRYEITNYPQNGYLDINCKTGEFVYNPAARVVSDSFEFCACDEYGAYSECATVKLSVSDEIRAAKYVFSDMSGNSAETAASVLCGKGVISANVENGKKLFSPDKEVSRIEFLKWAMNVFGASNIPEVKSTGFHDDSDISKEDKGYVYSAQKLGIINGKTTDKGVCFKPDDTITKAEASVILNNIIGYTATNKLFVNEKIPDFAYEAVSAMYEIGVYEPENGKLSASSPLTRAAAARMLSTVSCMLYE